MDANAVVQVIQSLGFPIVACGALFWLIIDQNKKHKDETDKLSEALNNNTTALTRLIDILSMKGDNNNGQA